VSLSPRGGKEGGVFGFLSFLALVPFFFFFFYYYLFYTTTANGALSARQTRAVRPPWAQMHAHARRAFALKKQ
jgi:hypothetical protein